MFKTNPLYWMGDPSETYVRTWLDLAGINPKVTFALSEPDEAGDPHSVQFFGSDSGELMTILRQYFGDKDEVLELDFLVVEIKPWEHHEQVTP